MLHFPSSAFPNTGPNGLPKRSDSFRNLNATQQKSSSDPMFLKIEEELHDARRVQQHGQEDDLRMALNMVISRVSELSNALSEAYKTQAELEVQLNVAKSNLQLVIANNEMLEEALKSGHPTDVGWRRSKEAQTPTTTESRPQSVDIARTHSENGNGTAGHSPVSPAVPPFTAPNTPPPPQPSDTRFFKFRFNSSANNSKQPPSRPQTPPMSAMSTQQPHSPKGAHTSSSSVPSLPAHAKEIEDLTAELEKEKTARKAVLQEKAALEAELESLSQALFEEANKMVAQERIKRAETEEELKEAHEQKKALRDALRIVETEVEHLKTSNSAANSPMVPSSSGFGVVRSRSSSQVALKSPPRSRTTSASSAVPPQPQKEKEKERSEEEGFDEQTKEEKDRDEEEEKDKDQSSAQHIIITGGAPETLHSPHSPSPPTDPEPKLPSGRVDEDASESGVVSVNSEHGPDADIHTTSTTSMPPALTETDEPSPWADVSSSSSSHALPTRHSLRL
ncbi:hypothetical protein D9758_011889 [Tetrapyrgos nigripes]|uniref:GDP/GTP exchange factor Sec2 N-terminal domain-containing protein n=1 Tax=Tetrapyrgos nigripes TaxID=182062 RepID=A0A8H5CRK9_9AGAR|nr:hypothetical protein D9758_011889 [Tetrapyrgos nigripes]